MVLEPHPLLCQPATTHPIPPCVHWANEAPIATGSWAPSSCCSRCCRHLEYPLPRFLVYATGSTRYYGNFVHVLWPSGFVLKDRIESVALFHGKTPEHQQFFCHFQSGNLSTRDVALASDFLGSNPGSLLAGWMTLVKSLNFFAPSILYLKWS